MGNSEKFWDRLASRFDRFEKKDELIYQNIIEKTRKHLKKDDVVLDFGCGTGIVSTEIAGDVAKVVGIDISSKMLDIARSKAQSRGLANIENKQSDILGKDLDGKNFDVLLGFYIIHLLDDPQVILKRIKQLLKPGGLFISTTPCLGQSGFIKFMLGAASLFGLVPKTKSFKTSGLEAMIESSGFEIVETEIVSKEGFQTFIVARKKI
jgi:2-polyprenyl-3-methyl-5-hydroxy-6-metoxy-1,4-benzoquinol methylase